jgi:hypothetical protein
MKLKNSHIVAGLALLIAGIVYAGNQYNWGTSLGGAWITPDDTKVTIGQILQIGSVGGSAPVIVAGGAPASVFSVSSTTIVGLTPGTTGQIIFENAGATAPALCLSTGIGTGAWVLVSATGTVCK